MKKTTTDISQQTSVHEPFSKALSEYEVKQIDWLWKNRIPFGCVTLLEGDGGIGKSFVLSSLASSVSTGIALPEDEPKEPRGVLLLATEDDPSVVLRPRFENHKANLEIVRCYDQSMLLDSKGLHALELEIKRFNVALVIIDPIVTFLGKTIDTSKASDVRSVMGPLHEIANRNHCAIVVVRHWTKNIQAQASQRGSGSVDFRNAARSVLQVIKISKKERYLTLEKSNYGAEGRTLRFEIENSVIKWTGVSDRSADDLLAEIRSNSENQSELEEAVDFLTQELGNGDPVASKELEEQARQLGISPITLKRAKKRLKVHAFKLKGNNKWMCEIRDEEDQSKGSGSSIGAQKHDPHPPILDLEQKNAV